MNNNNVEMNYSEAAQHQTKNSWIAPELIALDSTEINSGAQPNLLEATSGIGASAS